MNASGFLIFVVAGRDYSCCSSIIRLRSARDLTTITFSSISIYPLISADSGGKSSLVGTSSAFAILSNVSSHTARRTFATNAYLAGILPARIMLITGHKTEQAFFRYIRIDKVRNAQELAQMDFFK